MVTYWIQRATIASRQVSLAQLERMYNTKAGNGHSASWLLGLAAGKRAYATERTQPTYSQLRTLAELAWERASLAVVTDKEEYCNGFFTGWENARKGQSND